MNPQQVATPTSALPARPERPIKYVWPVTTPDGSVGYDHPLENYFDTTMAPCLLPPKPPAKLYDTIARAHDHRFQVTQDMVDPSWTTPRPLILNSRERRRSLARVSENSPDYMGIIPELPGWRPRRSSYEDRRGAVGVTPSEVNTLVPYIPPIDTSSPPPSREWLDEMAKRFLADAHADLEDSRRNTTIDNARPGPSREVDDSDFCFDYDTDSTLGGAVTISRTSAQQHLSQPSQVEPESSSQDADFDSETETETETDTDTDMHSNGGYNWSMTRISESSPHALGDIPRWIIPRKRPSVAIVHRDVGSTDVSRRTSPSSVTPPPSSDDEHAGKRRRGGKSAPWKRASKKPKRHASDTPARQGRRSIPVHNISDSDDDSSPEPAETLPSSTRSSSLESGTVTSSCLPVSTIIATATQMKDVRIASPRMDSPRVLPQRSTTSPKPSKLFPCMLDGCTQVCASAGDLQRHQQSLRHRAPSHSCLACGKSYTRPDALKRHLNSKASCKRVHATKQANAAGGGEVVAEANPEAMRVVEGANS